MAILTDTKARNIKPDDKPIAHGGITGLALHPSVNKGRGKWVLRYVSPVTGKRRNAGLGTYPEVGVAEAGRLGQEMRDLIAHGKDPLEKIVITEDKPRFLHLRMLHIKFTLTYCRAGKKSKTWQTMDIHT